MKIGKEKAEIDQEVGMRQGDNVSSVIFLFLMSAFAETLEKEWQSNNLPQPTLKNITNMNEGQLTGHIRERIRRGIDLIVNQILYIDDGAFFFESREDAKLGLEMIDKVFKTIGLEMHIGRGEQLSKTEIMYVPIPSFYQTPTNITIGAPPTQTLPPIASPADNK